MSPDPGPPDAVVRPAKRRHFIEDRPEVPTPLWRRVRFRMFASVALLLLLPLVPAAWHIVGPDEAPPPPVVLPVARIDWGTGDTAARALPASPDAALSRIAAARVTARLLADIPAAFGDAAVRAGVRYDAALTPAYVAEANRRLEAGFDDADVAAASGAAGTLRDIAAVDGFLRAALAAGRARRDPRALAGDYLTRLEIARSLVFAVATPADAFDAAAHERDVLAEIRFDADLLASDPEALKILLPALAAHAAAPDAALTRGLALHFDAALDAAPDAGLRAMRDRSPAPAGTPRFERIARFARKPNAHRREVSAMLANFGTILAAPTYVDAGRAFRHPAPPAEVSLSSRFLRDRVLATLGGDVVVRYFFPEQSRENSDLVNFALKFDAFTESRDIEGVAFLAHRRAELLSLLAHIDRTRFDAAATAYDLGLRYRRVLAGGKWPKDTDGIFDGLTDTYPLDPFTDQPVAYSRKNLTLHSPGADGVDKNGLEDPEFASELAELWEPTIPLEPGGEIDPAAFGIRIDKRKR